MGCRQHIKDTMEIMSTRRFRSYSVLSIFGFTFTSIFALDSWDRLRLPQLPVLGYIQEVQQSLI